MEFDTKQRVLLAIYTEYQKDLPEIKNITEESLGLTQEVFAIAIQKLENEGLINSYPDSAVSRSASIIWIDLRQTMMSPEGIGYIEDKLAMDKTLSGKEKVLKVSETVAKWGLDQLKDLTARVLAEMITSAT